MKRFGIEISDEIYKALLKLKQERKRPISSILHDIVLAWYKRNKWKLNP